MEREKIEHFSLITELGFTVNGRLLKTDVNHFHQYFYYVRQV